MTTEYTSNTLRTEDNEVGEWIHQPGFDITAKQDSALWTLDVNYSYLRRLYQEDLWGDESITTGQGSAFWQVIPQRLDFFVTNSRTESSISALQAQTQVNRQIVSTTSAGSTFRFQPMGKKDALLLEYTYFDSQSSDTQTDSTRHQGKLTYTFATWVTSSMQFQATHSEITYTGPFPDADATVATVSYAKNTRKLVLGIKVGHNWYSRGGRGDADDATYDVVFLWRATTSSTLRLNASHAIVDQSTNLAGNQGSINENTGINAAFNETTGSLTFTQQLGRTSLTFGGSWTKQEYAPDVPLDNNRIGLTFALARNFTPTTSITLDAKFGNRDFIDQGDDQDEIAASFRVNHQFGRTIDFNWGAEYIQQKSLTTNSFDNWRAVFTFRYTFVGSR